MNIYFFYKNESTSSWYDCTIEAWQENDNTYMLGKRVSSFTQIEKMHVHISKHPYVFHCARFDHELGTDLATGHNAKSPKEFRREMIDMPYTRMTEINFRSFQRFRSTMLLIYQTYKPLNYVDQLFKLSPVCRILAW